MPSLSAGKCSRIVATSNERFTSEVNHEIVDAAVGCFLLVEVPEVQVKAPAAQLIGPQMVRRLHDEFDGPGPNRCGAAVGTVFTPVGRMSERLR